MKRIWCFICLCRFIMYGLGFLELYTLGLGSVAAMSAHSLRDSCDASLPKCSFATASAPYMPSPIYMELR